MFGTLRARQEAYGGVAAPRQVQEGGNFCAKSKSLWEISRSPRVECITTRQSPQCVLLVREKFKENPEFRVGNFAVNLK